MKELNNCVREAEVWRKVCIGFIIAMVFHMLHKFLLPINYCMDELFGTDYVSKIICAKNDFPDM